MSELTLWELFYWAIIATAWIVSLILAPKKKNIERPKPKEVNPNKLTNPNYGAVIQIQYYYGG